MKNCQNCKKEFEVYSEDRDFYTKMKVPEPTFCSQCREIRRMVFRNERALYKRGCDLCKKELIMQYDKDVEFPVYCRECWWSDNWDPKSFAKEYDFSKSFFSQFKELINAVPRVSLVTQGNIVNSDYANRATDLRNCYLVFGTTLAEDSRYCVWINDSKQCMDCYAVIKSESCYECIDCITCYNCLYSQESKQCSDSWFLYNCRNVSSSLGCVNLRNSSYCIFNVQYSKEEYAEKVKEYDLGNRDNLEKFKLEFEEFKKKFIVPAMVTSLGENVNGNWLESCKNIFKSFNCQSVEESRYCTSVYSAKDCMDYTNWGAGSELIYECANVGMSCTNVAFSSECWSSLRDSRYCMNCHGSKELFGCIGIRSEEFCILNKKYSESEYMELREKIIQQMKEVAYTDKAGMSYLYGEFFPGDISPHAYNETNANEFYPKTKEEVISSGYNFKEIEKKNYTVTLNKEDLPKTVSDLKEEITKEIISCEHKGECKHGCNGVFRLIPEEISMYKRMGVPAPLLCSNCRHYERIGKRAPFSLTRQKCQCSGKSSDNGEYVNLSSNHGVHEVNTHCLNEFETPYSDRIIYCLECYRAEVS